MLRKLLKHSSIYLTGLIVGKLFTTAGYIILGRSLSLGDFGKVILFITLSTIITFIADFGMNQWYQKVIEKNDKKDLMQSIVIARTFTLIFSIIASFLFLTLTNSFSTEITLLFLLLLISEAYMSICDGYYLEKGEVLKVAFKPLSKNIVLLLGYLLTASFFSLDISVYLLVLGSYITLLWSFPWKILKKLNLSYWKNFKKVVSGGSHYAILVFTTLAYARGDSVIINYMLNSQSLGLYSAAYRFLESISIIPTSLAHNLFPVSAKENGITKSQLVKITTFVAVVGLCVSITVIILAPLMISILFDARFKPAIEPLRVFGVVLFFFFINSPLSTVVQSSKLIKRFLPFGIANTVVNLILNIVLIPLLGINGAALAMLTTEITGFFINLYFIKKIYSNV